MLKCIFNLHHQEKVNVTDDDKFNVILREFNFTCRTFTFIMMLKLQLQDYLFEGASESEVSDIFHKLTRLETAASILNDIAVSASGPMLYHARINYTFSTAIASYIAS